MGAAPHRGRFRTILSLRFPPTIASRHSNHLATESDPSISTSKSLIHRRLPHHSPACIAFLPFVFNFSNADPGNYCIRPGAFQQSTSIKIAIPPAGGCSKKFQFHRGQEGRISFFSQVLGFSTLLRMVLDTMQAANQWYFRYHASDIPRYPMILNGRIGVDCCEDFTYSASPIASVDQR
jgi:hypothetical protein